MPNESGRRRPGRTLSEENTFERAGAKSYRFPIVNPFQYFKISPEIICLAVMMYIRFPLSLRKVEGLLRERGIDITQETVWFCWNRFGPLFARSIRSVVFKTGAIQTGGGISARCSLGVMANSIISGALSIPKAKRSRHVTKRRDRKAAIRLLRKVMKRYGRPEAGVTDKLRSYKSALRQVGNVGCQETGSWPNSRAENSH